MKAFLLFLLISLVPPAFAQETKEETAPEIHKGEKALPGYWAVDAEALYQQMLKDGAKALKAEQVTKEKIKEDATRYSKMMLMHFTNDQKTFMYTVSGKSEATFKITAARPAKNEIDVEIESQKFGTEKSTLVVKGDSLLMAAEGGEGRAIQMKRVSKKEAPERIAAIQKLRKKE